MLRLVPHIEQGESLSTKASPISPRFHHHVGIDAHLAGADESGGARDAFLEAEVRFEGDGAAFAEGLGELGPDDGVVMAIELLGHPDGAGLPGSPDGGEHLRNGRDARNEGKVDLLHVRPRGEHGVGDDDPVGVADPREEGKEVRVQDGSFDHVVCLKADGLLNRRWRRLHRWNG